VSRLRVDVTPDEVTMALAGSGAAFVHAPAARTCAHGGEPS
jgi:hypothetical protein